MNYKCHNCGTRIKPNKRLLLLKYALTGKDKHYIKCNQCQTIHSFRIIEHIIKDNADKELKQKNEIKVKQYE